MVKHDALGTMQLPEDTLALDSKRSSTKLKKLR